MKQGADSRPAEVRQCAVCNHVIEKKPIKRMGNLYCSVYCAEVNRERMENLNLEKIDFDELGDVIGKFMRTCMDCPFPLKCREVREICSSYFEKLHDYITMRWCCHAIFSLSCMLSDGSVDMGVIKKLMARAEEMAGKKKYVGVSPGVLAMASGELAEDFSYEPGIDVIPPKPEEQHEHYLACLNCDRRFMDECLGLTAEAEKYLPDVEKMLGSFKYCGHARYDLATMLLNPKVNKSKIKAIIEKSKKIADEKSFEGGQYRIHFLSVARSINS